MYDLLKRLRNSGSRTEIELHEDREEAADRIAELEAQVKQARKDALEEAADLVCVQMARLAGQLDFDRLKAPPAVLGYAKAVLQHEILALIDKEKANE